MKFAIALLLSAVVAVKLRDEDEEGTFFLQVTACSQYAVDDVTCLSNNELLASSMNSHPT